MDNSLRKLSDPIYLYDLLNTLPKSINERAFVIVRTNNLENISLSAFNPWKHAITYMNAFDVPYWRAVYYMYAEIPQMEHLINLPEVKRINLLANIERRQIPANDLFEKLQNRIWLNYMLNRR